MPSRKSRLECTVLLSLITIAHVSKPRNTPRFLKCVDQRRMAFVTTAPVGVRVRSTTFRGFEKSQYCKLQQAKVKRTSFIKILRTDSTFRKSACQLVSMALSKVVVAGGTGFVGSRLVCRLISEGSSVAILSKSDRNNSQTEEVTIQKWSPSTDSESSLFDTFANADLVVNLSGSRVISRWTEEGKAEILSSRVDSTSLIARTIAAMPPATRPKCVVSASGVGYYGRWLDSKGTPEVDETSESGCVEQDFLVEVCRKWEDAGNMAMDKTRWVVLRIGFVLAPGGGVMLQMMPKFNRGLGGPIGSGTQAISFIHADDLIEMMITAWKDPSIHGVYNGTAPSPTTMNEMSSELGKALGKPTLFPVPGFVLKGMYGDGAQVILRGQRVIPNKWLRIGFQFQYPTIDAAIKAVAEEATK